MAVVQISKIQVRRGRKNVSGIPQLASGELGWAVDTQELYIGNGSVSEGSPAVGNTKVLTEKDSLIDFALKYQYQKNNTAIQTGALAGTPVIRTIQEKLDDYVSIKDFGAKGDGVTDDTVSIQRAIQQLYRNPATINNLSSRKILFFDSGIYRISDSITLPPNCFIKGAGQDRTLISQSTNFPAIKIDKVGDTIDNEVVSTNVRIEDLTIETTTNFSGMLINNTNSSYFKNIKIKGPWSISNPILSSSMGIEIRSLSNLTATKNNTFENCVVTGFSYGVYSEFNIFDNNFESCTFKNLGTGITFGSTSAEPSKDQGPSRNNITRCFFSDINRHGINVIRGSGNSSNNNSFVMVGNDGGDFTDAVYPIIYFDNPPGRSKNSSIDDFFQRQLDLTANSSVSYIPEVSGKIIRKNPFTSSIPAPSNTTNPITLFRLPIFSNLTYHVHYLHRSTGNNTMRSGKLTLIVNKTQNQISITDDYDFSGNPLLAANLEFSAQLVDLNGDNDRETLRIQYINKTTTDSNSNSFIDYWYEVIS